MKIFIKILIIYIVSFSCIFAQTDERGNAIEITGGVVTVGNLDTASIDTTAWGNFIRDHQNSAGSVDLRGTAGGDSNVVYVQPGENIATAITAIDDESSSNPYTLVLRAGRHTITTGLTLPDFISLKGEGMYSTELYTTSALDPMITFNEYLTISDLKIYHNGVTGDDQSLLTGPGSNTHDVIIINCLFWHNNTTYDSRIIDMSGSPPYDVRISNCYFRGTNNSTPDGEGIYVMAAADGSEPMVIENNTLENLMIGIRNQTGSNGENAMIIRNNLFKNMDQHSIYVNHGSGSAAYIYTYGNYFVDTVNDYVLAGVGGGAFTWYSAGETPKRSETNDIENLTVLDMTPADELTLSSKTVSVYQRSHIIDTEGDAALDTLQTINGLGSNCEMFIILRTANDGRDVLIEDGADNINCGSDRTLNDTSDRAILHWNGSSFSLVSYWDN